MNTHISYSKEGKDFNRDDEEVITCKQCQRNKTTMTGTELCDECWESNRRKSAGHPW